MGRTAGKIDRSGRSCAAPASSREATTFNCDEVKAREEQHPFAWLGRKSSSSGIVRDCRLCSTIGIGSYLSIFLICDFSKKSAWGTHETG